VRISWEREKVITVRKENRGKVSMGQGGKEERGVKRDGREKAMFEE
jgi:hypothetical protein